MLANMIAAMASTERESPDQKSQQDQVFESVAELFSVLSTPIRLKIISAV